MTLDDIPALRKIDPSGALSLMERTPKRLVPPSDAPSTCGKALGRPLNVVFGGVGGSGIVGDILTDYSRSMVDVPVSICRAMRIPNFVGRQTLFVAVSYSGETEETLSLLNQARQRKATIVTISSGGRLLSKSKEEKIPYLRVPAGLIPRIALPELLAAAIFVMGSAALFKETPTILSETAQSLTAQIDRVKPAVPSSENYAKRMAQTLVDKIPLLIGNEENGSVLRRFKNELNENSKMPAFYYSLPEGYHDDVEGLRALSQLTHTQPILLRGQEEVEGQRRTREKLRDLFSELGFPVPLQFEGIGKDRLSELLTAVTFGDYVSVYLAALRGIDPSELTLIPRFREAMRAA
jgi:glucose/mannose-6-phosphate isomerase